MIKRVLTYVAALLVLVLVIVAGRAEFPKYASRLLVFGILILADIVLWEIFRKYISSLRRSWMAELLRFLYWLPLALFAIYVTGAMIKPVQLWPAVVRIYLPGVMVGAYLWKIISMLFMLANEALALPRNLFVFASAKRSKSSFSWKRPHGLIHAGLSAASVLFILFISGFVFWVNDFQVRKVTVTSTDLPEGFDGYKIVQVSDLHLGSWATQRPLQRAVKMIADQHPDMVVFTGDLVNNFTGEANPFEKQLAAIKAPAGTFAILGNHDYGDYVNWPSAEVKMNNNKALEALYGRVGWKLLKNRHAIIHSHGDSIVLLGVENWSIHKTWGQKGDIAKALSGAEAVPYKILLSHDPTHWRAEVLAKYPGIRLMLAGHTHGMQIGWDTGRWRWSPSEYIFPEWAGLYTSETKPAQYLYVNLGLGNLGFPGRLGIRPEITVITLRRSR